MSVLFLDNLLSDPLVLGDELDQSTVLVAALHHCQLLFTLVAVVYVTQLQADTSYPCTRHLGDLLNELIEDTVLFDTESVQKGFST